MLSQFSYKNYVAFYSWFVVTNLFLNFCSCFWLGFSRKKSVPPLLRISLFWVLDPPPGYPQKISTPWMSARSYPWISVNCSDPLDIGTIILTPLNIPKIVLIHTGYLLICFVVTNLFLNVLICSWPPQVLETKDLFYLHVRGQPKKQTVTSKNTRRLFLRSLWDIQNVQKASWMCIKDVLCSLWFLLTFKKTQRCYWDVLETFITYKGCHKDVIKTWLNVH